MSLPPSFQPHQLTNDVVFLCQCGEAYQYTYDFRRHLHAVHSHEAVNWCLVSQRVAENRSRLIAHIPQRKMATADSIYQRYRQYVPNAKFESCIVYYLQHVVFKASQASIIKRLRFERDGLPLMAEIVHCLLEVCEVRKKERKTSCCAVLFIWRGFSLLQMSLRLTSHDASRVIYTLSIWLSRQLSVQAQWILNAEENAAKYCKAFLLYQIVQSRKIHFILYQLTPPPPPFLCTWKSSKRHWLLPHLSLKKLM